MKAFVLALVTVFPAAGIAQQPASAPEQRFYATLAEAANGTNLGKTNTVGAPTGGSYSDLRSEGAVVVGFDVWRGTFADHLVIRGICPIFQSAIGRFRGPKHGKCHGSPTTIEAKPGFAVAGIEAKGGLRVDGFEVTFMSIHFTGPDLDGADSYTSKWIGDQGGGKTHRLFPNQKPIIGIFGGSGAEIDRIGLLYYDRP